MWVSEVAGHERHCGPRDEPHLPEHRPAETLPFELRIFEFCGGLPRTMAIGGSMNSRGPPDHLPTGTPRTSSTTPWVHRLLQPPDDPENDHGGATTLRDPRLHPRRTSRAPEPSLHQRQELNTDYTDTAVRDNPKDTPEGSTETSVFHYTAGRVLSFATTPHRVMLIPNPDSSTTSPTTPTPSSPSSSAPDTEFTYPTSRMHPRRTTTGGRGAVPRPPRATPARPSLSTRPTSQKFTNSDTRAAYHHQPGRPK